MEQDFTKYEQALALKELGFDEPCIALFSESSLKEPYPNLFPPFYPEWCINAPLYQQAFRWFREKHNLVFNFISYSIVKPGEYYWSITWNDEAKAGGIVKTFEEAESACLDKLIEICKTKTNEQVN